MSNLFQALAAVTDRIRSMTETHDQELIDAEATALIGPDTYEH